MKFDAYFVKFNAWSCKYSSHLEFGQWQTLNICRLHVYTHDVEYIFLFFTADNEGNKDITKVKGQRFIREINQTAWFSQLLFPVVYCVEFSDRTSVHPASWRWILGNSSISGEISPLYMERIQISQMRLSLYACCMLYTQVFTYKVNVLHI